MSRSGILAAALAAFVVVAALLAPRLLDGAHREPAAPVADAAAPRSPPEPDSSAWRRGGEPRPVVPSVLARVAPRRAPPACPPGDARCGAQTAGAAGAAAAPCAEPLGRPGAEAGVACEDAGDGIEAIEIEWGAGDDP